MLDVNDCVCVCPFASLGLPQRMFRRKKGQNVTEKGNEGELNRPGGEHEGENSAIMVMTNLAKRVVVWTGHTQYCCVQTRRLFLRFISTCLQSNNVLFND